VPPTSTPLPGPGATLFEDNFQQGVSKDWKPVTSGQYDAGWGVNNNAYTLGTGKLGLSVNNAGNKIWNNYRVEFSMRDLPQAGPDKQVPENLNILALRVADDDNFIGVQVDREFVQLVAVKNGQLQLLSPDRERWSNGSDNADMIVEVDNNQIKVRTAGLLGKTILTYTADNTTAALIPASGGTGYLIKRATETAKAPALNSIKVIKQ
jgi:hypothetical protein